MEKNNIFIKAFPISWPLTAVVVLVLWLAVGQVWALSFLLGSATSLMMMSLMYKSTMKIVVEDAQHVQRRVVMNYVFRYFFYGFILVASALLDSFEVIAVAIGLFTFRISMYIAMFLERRGAAK